MPGPTRVRWTSLATLSIFPIAGPTATWAPTAPRKWRTTPPGFVYADDRESGEFGFEDVINSNTAASTPNGVLDGAFVDAQGVNRWAEDVNDSGTLDTYGGIPRLMPPDAGVGTLTMLSVAAPYTPAGNVYNLYTTPIDRNVARANRAVFFRRALKLVDGGRGNVPSNGSQGLTVATENPVYIEGNYNACTNAMPGHGWEPGGRGLRRRDRQRPRVGVGHRRRRDVAVELVERHPLVRQPARRQHRRLDTRRRAEQLRPREAVTTWYRVAVIARQGPQLHPANQQRP